MFHAIQIVINQSRSPATCKCFYSSSSSIRYGWANSACTPGDTLTRGSTHSPSTPDFHALLASRFFPFTISLPKLPTPYVIPCAATSLTEAGIQETNLEFAFPASVPICPASPPITTLATTLVQSDHWGRYMHTNGRPTDRRGSLSVGRNVVLFGDDAYVSTPCRCIDVRHTYSAHSKLTEF